MSAYIIARGNLVKDGELRFSKQGLALFSFRIGCDCRPSNAIEGVNYSIFYDVTAFGGQAERCAESLTKGVGVVVTGYLTLNKWNYEDKE